MSPAGASRVPTRITRLRDTHNFGAWVTQIDDLLAGPVSRYQDRLAANADEPDPSRPRSKAIKDSLWGMIEVTESELVILDSPPVQRLRDIAQLGFSYLTYPTARYSRFEHVLGATHQAERLLRAVARRSDPAVGSVVEAAIPVTRLAALLHDIGHLPASHLGERYFTLAECRNQSVVEEIQSVRGDLVEVLGVNPALGELLSLAIVITPTMWDLLTTTAKYLPQDVETAALAIVATPVDVQTAFIPNVISNVIDADKLDYMFRDAHATQVPLAVDLDRLLHKLKIVSVRPSALTPALQRLTEGDGASGNLLGIDLAGHDLLYDLLASRSMLYERIYTHHKTRAAERVGLDILDALGATPIELLAYDDSVFVNDITSGRSATAADRVRRIRERDLPRRAFAISYGYLSSAAESQPGRRPLVDEDSQFEFESLTEVLGNRADRDDLLGEVVRRRDELAQALGAEEGGPLWLDTEPPNPVLDPDLFVEYPDGSVTSKASFPQKASAYTRVPARTTFLYAGGTSRDVALSNIACELVIKERFGLHLGRDTTDYAKVNLRDVEETKRDLEAVRPELYDRAGELRPRSKVLRNQESVTLTSRLADKFHAFNVGDAPGRQSMSVPRIQAFLDQFPEHLVRTVLDVLDGMTFLTREHLGRDLVASLTAPGGAHARTVAFPLTSSPEKSAAGLGTYFRDAADRPYLAGDVSEALHRIESGQSDRMVAIDDFCLSGTQSATVVQLWFATPDDDLLLPDEADIATPLSASHQDLLRRTPLDFRFVYHQKSGGALLESTASAFGIQHCTSGGVLGPHSAPSFADLAGANADELREFLRTVGISLLRSTKQAQDPERWTDDRVNDRALGYSNAEMLVATQNNCPTSTITALWSRGLFRDVPWQPLFDRPGGSDDLSG